MFNLLKETNCFSSTLKITGHILAFNYCLITNDFYFLHYSFDKPYLIKSFFNFFFLRNMFFSTSQNYL